MSRYQRIEAALLSEFQECYANSNVKSMHRVAADLSQFRGYQLCVDVFVEESLRAVGEQTAYADAPYAVDKTRRLVADVFDRADKIVERYIKDIYTSMLTLLGKIL